ncbi:hypothetical protein KIN20_015130 [Parelaphostrongylus tenuis]|uniref:Uncharacterized protein n=1 Tax=Parelaphostrongylus tenuis TaxID=148309 RepID=A0AAD5QM15_PARTN|nr:hypothetical protein KIN20_015130 [Parelaphostrongylus tenuis]
MDMLPNCVIVNSTVTVMCTAINCMRCEVIDIKRNKTVLGRSLFEWKERKVLSPEVIDNVPTNAKWIVREK